MGDCAWPARRRAAAVAQAFTDAMAEHGIPGHGPAGDCPYRPCPCRDEQVAARVEQRALELAAARLGIPLEALTAPG